MYRAETNVQANKGDKLNDHVDECGPMKQLTAMMKRINADAWKNMTPLVL